MEKTLLNITEQQLQDVKDIHDNFDELVNSRYSGQTVASIVANVLTILGIKISGVNEE